MEVTLASVLNLASIGGLWYLAGCLNQETSKLKEIQKAKVFSPSRLLHQLARPEFLATLKKSSENPDEYSLRAFIEGYTECDKPFQSVIDEKTKLVLSLYFKDDIYSNDSLSKVRGQILPKDDTLETRAPLHFYLKDPNKDDKCQVHRNSNVKANYALEKIAESREYKNLNWFEKILVYIGLLLELIAVITRTAMVFRGIKIGWAENEYGIILGNALTAYGKVLYNIKEKTLRMDNPQYFVHDKSNIVKKLKRNIYTIQGKMGLMLIPFIMTSVFLTKKALYCYRRFRRRRMEQRLDKLWKTKSVKMKDDYKCIVCFDRPRNIIAKPCLHFSLCSICYNQLDRKSCPVCKKSILDVIEVYVT